MTVLEGRRLPAPLTIAHLLAPGPFGGLEEVVESLATGHAARGHHLHALMIIDQGSEPHPFVERLAGTQVRVHDIPVGPRAYLTERTEVRRRLERIRPDIVHAHGDRVDVLDGPLARRLGIPVVTTVHGFTSVDWKKRVYELLQRRSYRRCNAVVTVSRLQAEQLARHGVPRDRLHVIPNGWRPIEQESREAARGVLGIPAGDIRVGWIGRLSREKGPDLAVEALARIGDLNVSLSMIGDGAERAALVGLAQRHGVQDRLVLHGLLAGAGRLARAFDLILLSSRTEGVPIVLFEAIAAGVPVVATAVGGIPDVLSEREGWLVRSPDPVELARAIEAALADPSGRSERSAAARTRVEQEFGLDQWLSRYEELYRSLIERRGA